VKTFWGHDLCSNAEMFIASTLVESSNASSLLGAAIELA
jgi:hypothetical protein